MEKSLKYEIKMVGLDDFELHYYKNNEEKIKPFRRTVELAKKLQSVDADARFRLYQYLTSIGKTKDDLIIETKDNEGRIIRDETNYREFEAKFILDAQYQMVEDLYKTLFNMSMEELVVELGLNDENESFLFGNKIRNILINGVEEDKIPCKNETESLSSTEIK